MTSAPAKRLLVVGWDAADWLVIDALFARGELPNLKRLVGAGVRSDLHTLQPKLSPLLWSTIASGKTADKHGILNFVEPDPAGEGVRVSSSTTRRTKALWNIATQAGRRVHVVGWYASHPAEPINGVVVTNLFQEGEPASPDAPWRFQPGTVHPPELADALAARRVHTARLPRERLAAVFPQGAVPPAKDERVHTLARQLARMHSIHGAACAVLDAPGGWDCAMVFYDAIDTIGHHFMQYRPPRMQGVSAADERTYGGVMDGVYREHDRMLGELLARAGGETTVLLLSDHGFYSDHRRPVIKAGTTPAERAALESSWHRPEGVLVLAGPGVRPPAGDAPQAAAAPTLLDIAPTVLALLGLPAGADMDGRVLTEWLDPARPAPNAVPSWDTEPGEAGLHPATMRQDPFEAQDALNQLIELGYMPEMGGNTKVLLDLTRRETQFNLGVVYMTTGRAMLAVPVFQALATAHPDETRYGLTLAQCMLMLHRSREAVAVLDAVIAHHPSALEPQMLLVGALANIGEHARAGDLVRALERAHASRSELAAGFGDMCSAVGRWQDAEQYYARAAKANPLDPAVHVARARAALGRGEYEPSAEHALNALDLRQSLPDAHYTLGVALAWLGQHEHAITSFDIALAWEPRMVDAHRFQAMLRSMAGGTDAARAHRARVAELRDSARQAGADAPPEPAWGPAAWAAHTGNTEA